MDTKRIAKGKNKADDITMVCFIKLPEAENSEIRRKLSRLPKPPKRCYNLAFIWWKAMNPEIDADFICLLVYVSTLQPDIELSTPIDGTSIIFLKVSRTSWCLDPAVSQDSHQSLHCAVYAILSYLTDKPGTVNRDCFTDGNKIKLLVAVCITQIIKCFYNRDLKNLVKWVKKRSAYYCSIYPGVFTGARYLNCISL